LLFAAISATHAQETQTNPDPLRLEFSFSQTSADAKRSDNEINTKSSVYFSTLTYYFKRQFFAEAGYGRPSTHEVTINDQIIPLQASEKTALSLYGLGFRSFRRGSNGEYLGIGLRYTSDLSSGANGTSTQTIRLFTQKDTRQRYGVVQLSRENGAAGEISKLGGRHVWFNENGIGFGVQWAFGLGREIDETGLETRYRSRDIGILVMYRPKLLGGPVYEEPLDESTENPFEDSSDIDYIDTSDEPSCDPMEDPLCESEEDPPSESTDDPFSDSTENPFMESDENPFTESDENPFTDAEDNPFIESDEQPLTESDDNPFLDSDENPFTESDENPFADSDENPFCDPEEDPFCEPAEETIVAE
jgi:hypothetical protein